jgi:hypothetical protein
MERFDKYGKIPKTALRDVPSYNVRLREMVPLSLEKLINSEMDDTGNGFVG